MIAEQFRPGSGGNAGDQPARVRRIGIFEHCSNAPEPVSELRRAMRDVGVTFDEGDGILPMRPGEDFGVFGRYAPSAMLFLGAGETYAGLHNPDYDFPDELIPVGSKIFVQTVRNILG
ncbi:M20/M25/M40 family metallo-hydrolase [Rhizobium leguminosarum]|uniref:M20/M25/M40 family metallo-hydrolase n=1 Tax=Rhizobium leguminosarum TaxID=384 RepID=UPI000373A4FD|nr:M20/M25/M40 family metallo-hydrolase [Rhizobium leguminosarum]